MSEQWTWEPVENKTDIRCSCESTDCSKALIVAYDEMQIYDVHMGGGFSFMLPDDLRLCRRVPAPAQGVPVEVRERLAAVAHEIWAHWMHYLFSKCEQNPDGSVTIPVGLVLRWGRQIDTPYNELSEQERESDRHQADKIMAAWLDSQPQTGQE